MPTEADIASAIATLARIERADWLPKPPAPPGAVDDPTESAAGLLESCGPAVVPQLVAALPVATGTGRVVLASLILKLDRARGEAVIEDLCSDTTPAWVDTCLVGHRSVDAWARSCSPRGSRAEPIPRPSTWQARKWLIRAVVVLALVGAWWWLSHR